MSHLWAVGNGDIRSHIADFFNLKIQVTHNLGHQITGMLFKSPISTSLASLLVRASSLAALPHLKVGQGSGCDWTCISTGLSGSGRHWAGSSAGAWKGRRGLVGTWQCRSGRTPSTGACCNRRCLAESPGSGVISTSWLFHLVELLVAVRPGRPAAHDGGGRREPPGGRRWRPQEEAGRA